MTKRILRIPTSWLTLGVCNDIFNAFKKSLEFNQPFPPFNTRYEGKLEGILESTRQTFNGKLLNSTLLDASAAYFNNIIRGHPFINGNKRMGVLFTHIFLISHRINFTLTFKEMYDFAVFIAEAGGKGINSGKTKELCRRIIFDFTTDLVR